MKFLRKIFDSKVFLLFIILLVITDNVLSAKTWHELAYNLWMLILCFILGCLLALKKRDSDD